jgi:chromate transporter
MNPSATPYRKRIFKIDDKLKELAKLFLKIGSIGFGGPAGHLAMLEEEVVNKRRWMSHEHFLDLYGSTNLIPGPNSTEMTIHIGRERAGWKGMIVAGLCFIMPAVIISGLLGWAYSKYGALPEVKPWTYGIQPAIIAVIIRAVIPLGRKAVKSIGMGVLGAASLAACLEGINDIFVLFGAAFIALLWSLIQQNPGDKPGKRSGLLMAVIQAPAITLAHITNASIFLTFLKIGAVWFGGGYVLFGLLDNELVVNGIMSRQQLIDAIAVGQITPGPLFSSVTFIGWQMKGLSGAIFATLGVFIPSFLFVALLNPLVPKMRSSKIFSTFLDAINVASIAVIVAVLFVMGKETLTSWKPIVIGIVSLGVAFGFRRLNLVFIVFGGALAGYLLTLI